MRFSKAFFPTLKEAPAEAEVVIEGIIDPMVLEPEGPFGESHGHIALEEFNMPMRVTAITRKAKPVIPSYISQVTPSESSVIKRVAYETGLGNALRLQRIFRKRFQTTPTGWRKANQEPAA